MADHGHNQHARRAEVDDGPANDGGNQQFLLTGNGHLTQAGNYQAATGGAGGHASTGTYHTVAPAPRPFNPAAVSHQSAVGHQSFSLGPYPQQHFLAFQPHQFSLPPPPPPPPPQRRQAFTPDQGISHPPLQQQALPAFQPQAPLSLPPSHEAPASDSQALQSDNRQDTRARRHNREIRGRGNRGRGGRGRSRGHTHHQYEYPHQNQRMVLHQAQGAPVPYQYDDQHQHQHQYQHQQDWQLAPPQHPGLTTAYQQQPHHQLPSSSDHCACGLNYSRFWNEFGECWLQASCPCGRLFPAVLGAPAAPAALPFQQQAASTPSAPPPPTRTPPARPSLQWRAPGAPEDPRPRPAPPPLKMVVKRKNIRQQTKLAKRVQDMEEKLAAEKAALEEKSQRLKRQVQEDAANDDRP